MLRVGTVINRRFRPDLVRVEFPVNGWSACDKRCLGQKERKSRVDPLVVVPVQEII